MALSTVIASVNVNVAIDPVTRLGADLSLAECPQDRSAAAVRSQFGPGTLLLLMTPTNGNAWRNESRRGRLHRASTN
jgi:hypothetical protein